MTDTNVFQLSQPGTFADPLTEVLRTGARALLAQAVEAEVAALLSGHADKLTDGGHQRLVRHGQALCLFLGRRHPCARRPRKEAGAVSTGTTRCRKSSSG